MPLLAAYMIIPHQSFLKDPHRLPSPWVPLHPPPSSSWTPAASSPCSSSSASATAAIAASSCWPQSESAEIMRVGCAVLRFEWLGLPLLRIIFSCGSAFAVGWRAAATGLAGFVSSFVACSSSCALASSCPLFAGSGTRSGSHSLPP